MSISVIDDDEIFSEVCHNPFLDDHRTYTVALQSFGHAVLPGTKATNNTLWYNGSCTKAHTGALLAKMIDSKTQYPTLADKGWSTTMASVIRDDFMLQDDWATNHATVEDASCHNTGMGRHDIALLKEVTLPDGTTRAATQRDHARQMRHLNMGDEPRRRFIYSNHMYMALSHAVETVAGKQLGDALREHIWHPLGMKSTFLGNDEAEAGSDTIATGYSWDSEKKVYEPLSSETVTGFCGTGGVISTVSDAAKWLRCLLNKGEPLSTAVHADIRKPRIIISPVAANGSDITTYGLGWQRTVYKGHVLYSHSGATMTHGCEMFWLPDFKFGFVAAGNAHRVSNCSSRSLAYRLIDEKIGVPVGERKDFSALLRGEEDTYKAVKDTAMEVLFPNLGDTPMSCPIKTGELTGAYRDAGYGTMVFTEVSHPEAE
ncbi:Beta-lactamase/transpeptidase-like protein [Akanthomyces lecanii RCEF 1005]|uniref:Beta-lactamase/transpeptidase-like protein n=1 Tax=Akanthomyces lecanii RCEF 1005 TaxID=1081108 RepID=A0A168H3Y0_CORDF|nr:Beta-lactamase/transpeptidase-like protein [Akanthomyces lecanii RCEF 1005]